MGGRGLYGGVCIRMYNKHVVVVTRWTQTNEGEVLHVNSVFTRVRAETGPFQTRPRHPLTEQAGSDASQGKRKHQMPRQGTWRRARGKAGVASSRSWRRAQPPRGGS